MANEQKGQDRRTFRPSHAPFLITKPGDSLTSIAQQVAANSIRVRGHDEAKAILIHNNVISDVAPLSPGQILNVSDSFCDDIARMAWAGDSISVSSRARSLSPEVIQLMQESASGIGPMASFGQQADVSGWVTGDDVSTVGGFFALGADSALSVGKEMLDQIQFLGRKVVEDATAKFGKAVLMSKDATKLEPVQRYLQTNLNYVRLQNLIAQLPKQLKNGLGNHLKPTPGIQASDARWVKRIALVEEKGAARFFREAPALLENKIVRFGQISKGTGFALPAAIGLYNIARASPTERFQVSINETVGFGMGAFGAEVGMYAGGIMVAAIGLTGVGAFLLLFLAVGASSYVAADFGQRGVRSLAGLFQ
jgi:hypothetical protein